MTFIYNVFDLVMQVPFSCPGLPEAPAGLAPDVVLQEGEVPRQLGEALATGPDWEARAGMHLFRGGRFSGRFLVEDGRRITLQLNPKAEATRVRAQLLTVALVAALRQRGRLILHATAVATPGGCAALVSGPSGVGKSTTLAALMARGCAVLSDDITVLFLGPDGRAWVMPGLPHMHLSETSAVGLGRSLKGLPRHALRKAKAVVPLGAAMAAKAVPVGSLFLLECHPGDHVEVHPLQGVARFTALQDSIYGPLLAEEHPALFPLMTALADTVRISVLRRPEGRWSADEVAAAVLND